MARATGALGLGLSRTKPGTTLSSSGEHRQEISDFSGRVAGGFPEFRAMSYRELWRDWESGQPPDWLRAHLQRLRARYEIAI